MIRVPLLIDYQAVLPPNGMLDQRACPARHRMAVTPDARHLTRFSRHFSTTGPARPRRQEAQIVQSCMNLDDFLPEFTRSWRHLISVRSVGSNLPPSSGTTRAPAGIGVRCSSDHDRPSNAPGGRPAMGASYSPP